MRIGSAEGLDRAGVTVVAVEPCDVARRRLVEMLRATERVELLCAAACAHAAIGALADRTPQVLVTASDMATCDVANLRAAAPGAALLVLLREADPLGVGKAREWGAAGMLIEHEATPQRLEAAVLALSVGLTAMPSSLGSPLERRTPGHIAALTPREDQVLGLLTAGFSNKQIARRLGVSPEGAKRHVANILRKLGCPNRAAAVACGIAAGDAPPVRTSVARHGEVASRR